MTNPTDSLTENDVVEAVRRHLASQGWAVSQALTTTQTGVDIIATSGCTTIHVEAKGATSSKPGSNRYGLGFNRGQVFDHVAKAVLVALTVASRNDGTRAAIAVPDNDHHREFVGNVAPILNRLDIVAFFVAAADSVRVEGSLQSGG